MAEKEVADFEAEVQSFVGSKLPLSASKIENATKLGVKHAKHVVYILERFIAKCPPENKLGAIYTIDSIAKVARRREKEDKSCASLLARFESKLDGIFGSIGAKVSSSDKERIKKVTGLWYKQKIFSIGVLRDLTKKYPDFFEPQEPVALPDTASLVATLAQMQQMSAPKVPDPLDFDYGDDTDGEGQSRGGKNQQVIEEDTETITVPPVLADILSKITSVTSAPATTTSQPSTPSFQTSFTLHQQQQLANLLAAQGVAAQLMSPMTPSTPGIGISPSSLISQQPVLAGHAVVQPLANIPEEFQSVPNHPASTDRQVSYDQQIELDQIRILTRTLYVGGLKPNVTRQMLEDLFAPYKPEHVGVFPEKSHAFVRLKTRALAETAKRELWNNKTSLEGEQLRINWACGIGKKETFDRRMGSSIATVDEMSDNEKRWYLQEIGLDYLRYHADSLLQLIPNSSKVRLPFHFGGLCIEEPDTDLQSNNKRPHEEEEGGHSKRSKDEIPVLSSAAPADPRLQRK